MGRGEAESRRATGSGGRFGRRSKRRVTRRDPLVGPPRGGSPSFRRAYFSPALPERRRVWGGPGPGRATTAPPSQRRRSGPARRRARRRFGGPGRRPENRPRCRFCDGRAFFRGGSFFASAACVAAVPAKGGRTRPAPDRQSRPREKGGQSAPGTTQQPAPGWTRWGGRVGPPSRRRRRSGPPAAPRRGGTARGRAPGPSRLRRRAFFVSQGYSARRAAGSPRPRRLSQPRPLAKASNAAPARALGAASTRAGRSGERGREPLPVARRAGRFSLGAGHFCRHLLGARASGPTRAGSRYHCSAVGAAEVRSRQAAGSGPLRRAAEAAGAQPRPPGMPVEGQLFFVSKGIFFARACAEPSGLGRTRGRVALPVLRRRSGRGAVPPGGGLGAASAGRRSGG